MRRILEISELREFFGSNPPQVSFEFFPPKTPEAEVRLWEAILRLEPLAPAFVSVTYGAGGSTRERTHGTVRRILNQTRLTPAAHLTCVGASRQEVDQVAKGYWEAGVRHLVALRGDPPPETGVYEPHPEGYAHASDLVQGLKELADFEISVATFPEGHPETGSINLELENLKRKIDAGATRAITQYFFDTDLYFRFLDRASAAGIDIPIVPGILPVTSVATLIRFSQTCGATVPDWLTRLFEGLDDIPQIRNLLAMQVAASQCLLLRRAGVEHFHFFTMNRAELTWALCRVLGLQTSPVLNPALP